MEDTNNNASGTPNEQADSVAAPRESGISDTPIYSSILSHVDELMMDPADVDLLSPAAREEYLGDMRNTLEILSSMYRSVTDLVSETFGVQDIFSKRQEYYKGLLVAAEDTATKECLICLDKEGCFWKLPCGHIYHENCALTWFVGKRKNTCPNCRRIYQPDD